MNQLLLGASIPFIIAAVVYLARRCRASVRMLVLTSIFMAICALWAVVPDIPRMLGLSGLYSRLALDPRCDIFFWHYTIDLKESDSHWFAAGYVFIMACLLAAAWRELYITEKT